MQVKIDVLEGLQRKITVEIPAEEVNNQVLTKLKKVQKSVKLDGFRKGKVPMKVVEQKYAASVRQDVLGDLIESTYPKAIAEEKIIPATQPQIKPISGFADGDAFVYEAELEIIPDFDVKGLDSMTVNKPVAEVSDADIKKMIETLRKQTATWTESVEAKVGEGDRATIDFVGEIEGEKFEGGSAEGVPVVIGSKQMLAEFENALLDHKKGDEVKANVNFPADYHGKDVAGKEAIFSITIQKVEKPVLPDVGEEFAKKFGITSGSVEELEKTISDNMQRELKTAIKRNVSQQVMQHLVDSNNVVIPEGMVAQEKERMMKEAEVEKKVSDPEEIEKIKEEQFDQPARRRVLLGLIMGKLFEKREIKPDQELVNQYISDMASTYEQPEQVFEYYKNNQNAMEQLYAQAMEEQLITALLDDAKVIDEMKTFDEVMNAK